MVFLGLAVHLPFRAVLALGVVIVLGHNALDFLETGTMSHAPWWYTFLHKQGPVQIPGIPTIFVAYPFLSWTGLMLLGFCFGKFYTHTETSKRKSRLLLAGAAALLFFAVLRYINVYGDSQHWSTQKNTLYTFLSFINVVKYPPSLLYMCVTIGPALLFLAFAGQAKGRAARIISVYGSVPFFYYILHFYILHVITAFFYMGRGHSFKEGMHGYTQAFNFTKPGEGIGLLGVYAIWIATVAALYPLCKWFSNYKKTHKQWWLSYL
jgi:uncharacterized membrane protein